MFHNYQTRGDIQKIIIDVLVVLDRPAREAEVVAWVWNRMLIDGIESGVRKTIRCEMRAMRIAGVLRLIIREDHVGLGVTPARRLCVRDFYAIRCPLTAIASTV